MVWATCDYSRACSPSEVLFVLTCIREGSKVVISKLTPTQSIQIARKANILSIFMLVVKNFK